MADKAGKTVGLQRWNNQEPVLESWRRGDGVLSSAPFHVDEDTSQR